MCTIIALFRVRRDVPLLVAANRDEAYARPSRPPEPLCDAPRAAGGVDVLGGGTWMGVTAAGLFVGLTNQRTYAGPVHGLRSRGEVAREVLRRGTVEEALAYVERLDPRAYNSFNLFVGDAGQLHVAYARREEGSVRVLALPPGVHVLANDEMGSPHFPKVDRALAGAEALVASPLDAAVGGLGAVLADHRTPPEERVPAPPAGSRFDHAFVRRLQALCIHTEVYGTVSSTVLAIGEEGVRRYLFADGPPCQTPFHDVTSILRTE